VIPLLETSLKDEDRTVREKSAEALGKVGQTCPQLVIPLLKTSLKDEDRTVRRNSAEALGKVGQTCPQLVIPLLKTSLKDEDRTVRRHSAAALGNIGQTCPELVILLLETSLKDEQEWVRRGSAEALGKVGQTCPERVIPLLTQTCQDKDQDVRIASLKALKKYDLSPFIQSQLACLVSVYAENNWEIPPPFLTSTPLSSLLESYEKYPSMPATTLRIIITKCLEDRFALSLDLANDAIVFHEKGEMCTFAFSNTQANSLSSAQAFIQELEKKFLDYPEWSSITS
jgi:hypothetical protein